MNISTMSDLDRVLRARNLRVLSAFHSYGTWKVSIGSDAGPRYVGAHRELQRAFEEATAHCDEKRALRHPQGVL